MATKMNQLVIFTITFCVLSYNNVNSAPMSRFMGEFIDKQCSFPDYDNVIKNIAPAEESCVKLRSSPSEVSSSDISIDAVTNLCSALLKLQNDTCKFSTTVQKTNENFKSYMKDTFCVNVQSVYKVEKCSDVCETSDIGKNLCKALNIYVQAILDKRQRPMESLEKEGFNPNGVSVSTTTPGTTTKLPDSNSLENSVSRNVTDAGDSEQKKPSATKVEHPTDSLSKKLPDGIPAPVVNGSQSVNKTTNSKNISATVIPAVNTPAPVTVAPNTPLHETQAPVTQAPVNPAQDTVAPVTPAPATPAPVNPGLIGGAGLNDGGKLSGGKKTGQGASESIPISESTSSTQQGTIKNGSKSSLPSTEGIEKEVTDKNQSSTVGKGPGILPTSTGGDAPGNPPSSSGGVAPGNLPSSSSGIAPGNPPASTGGVAPGNRPASTGGVEHGNPPASTGGVEPGNPPASTGGVAPGNPPASTGGVAPGNLPSSSSGVAPGNPPSSAAGSNAPGNPPSSAAGSNAPGDKETASNGEGPASGTVVTNDKPIGSEVGANAGKISPQTGKEATESTTTVTATTKQPIPEGNGNFNQGGSSVDFEAKNSKNTVPDTDFNSGNSWSQGNQNSGSMYVAPKGDVSKEPSSGNFMAYFLTAVILCVAGYVLFHNKQKIVAFIVEGRNGRRAPSRRPKTSDYKKLQSNVEEVMPSLEKSTTGSKYIY